MDIALFRVRFTAIHRRLILALVRIRIHANISIRRWYTASTLLRNLGGCLGWNHRQKILGTAGSNDKRK